MMYKKTIVNSPVKMTKTKDFAMSDSESCAGRNRFDFIRIFVLIAGLIAGGCQMRSQHAVMPPIEETAPPSEIMRISKELDKPKFAGIVSAIDYHTCDYPIRSTELHQGFSNNLLREYLGNLDSACVLARANADNKVMAYEELGFEIEKAWCNNDVQRYIDDSRKGDNQSADAGNSYRAFEEFAKYCLAKDNKSCADMDKGQIVEKE